MERPATELRLHTAYYADKSDLADALPYALDLSNRLESNPDHEPYRGRVLMLAGRASEAIEPLRRAASTCQILPVNFGPEWQGAAAFMNLHAHLWLGRALEETGDTAGACAAYGDVLARWGNATPRSVTRDTAKARSRALRCDASRCVAIAAFPAACRALPSGPRRRWHRLLPVRSVKLSPRMFRRSLSAGAPGPTR